MTKATLKWTLALAFVAPSLCAPALEHSRSALMAQEVTEQAAGEVDEAGRTLVENLVSALRERDEKARVQAALPLLHRALLTPDERDIDPSVKKFGWKKAVSNAPGLASPVRVVRVRSKGNLTIGEGSKNVERGRVDDYFLARQDEDALPARVTLFFPDKGEPKVYDLSGI